MGQHPSIRQQYYGNACYPVRARGRWSRGPRCIGVSCNNHLDSQSSNLDYDSKKWRLFADILNDIAIFLELMCQYFKGYVTAVLCVSSIAKSIVGVAGGATRAALTQHQARSNNMADVSAKDGSQETLVNLAAFLFSLLLLRIVAGNPWLLYSIFISFTLLHIFANYRAVSCVVMETFNRSRYAIVVRHFLEMAGDIAPVAWVNAHESVWIQCGKPFVSINLGVPLSSIAPTSKELQCRIQDAVGDQKAEPAYLLAVVRDSSRHYNINIVLSSESTVKDQMEAMFHAFLLEAILLKLRVGVDHPWAVDIADVENTAEDLSSDDHRLFRSSRAMVNKCFPLLWKALEGSEWQTDRALFGATEWRVTWCEDETVSPGDTSHSKQV
ncbi:RUS family member 1 isoform X2 [Dermacentor silvarum]|uniref:RUS family member 1 isoform X2 n=1 Tax=Dermacentor silvarum TaxID=543639 RepID=UPI0018975704|nr:RUS family member 1 isoform X2 [Dermacentor silvarum]